MRRFGFWSAVTIIFLLLTGCAAVERAVGTTYSLSPDQLRQIKEIAGIKDCPGSAIAGAIKLRSGGGTVTVRCMESQ